MKYRYILVSIFSLMLFLIYINNLNAQQNPMATISHDRVNIRNYPDTITGTVNFQLNTGQRIHIFYRTNERKIVNGMTNYWYYIIVYDGEFRNQWGWVFGEYVRFSVGWEEEYWTNMAPGRYTIDERTAYKNIAAREILRLLVYRGNDTTPRIELLEPFSLISSADPDLWYLRENWNSKNRYETYFGSLLVYVNEERGRWLFASITINQYIEGLIVYPGMTVEELIEIFGNEYYRSIYGMDYYNEYFDTYYWSFEVENNRIKSIRFTFSFT